MSVDRLVLLHVPASRAGGVWIAAHAVIALLVAGQLLSLWAFLLQPATVLLHDGPAGYYLLAGYLVLVAAAITRHRWHATVLSTRVSISVLYASALAIGCGVGVVGAQENSFPTPLWQWCTAALAFVTASFQLRYVRSHPCADRWHVSMYALASLPSEKGKADVATDTVFIPIRPVMLFIGISYWVMMCLVSGHLIHNAVMTIMVIGTLYIAPPINSLFFSGELVLFGWQIPSFNSMPVGTWLGWLGLLMLTGFIGGLVSNPMINWTPYSSRVVSGRIRVHMAPLALVPFQWALLIWLSWLPPLNWNWATCIFTFWLGIPMVAISTAITILVLAITLQSDHPDRWCMSVWELTRPEGEADKLNRQLA